MLNITSQATKTGLTEQQQLYEIRNQNHLGGSHRFQSSFLPVLHVTQSLIEISKINKLHNTLWCIWLQLIISPY